MATAQVRALSVFPVLGYSSSTGFIMGGNAVEPILTPDSLQTGIYTLGIIYGTTGMVSVRADGARALATGSSVAAIPSNLEAANKSGVPKDISELIIPIGATIHMDGSCLAAVLKIAFLFGIFHLDFSGMGTLLTAVGIALLSGIVMSGIPGGGFIGELLIISLYGFPLEAFPIISMIGVLVDPPATLVNSTGDNVCSMIVARMLGGKNWMKTGDF